MTNMDYLPSSFAELTGFEKKMLGCIDLQILRRGKFGGQIHVLLEPPPKPVRSEGGWI
jgi:hypothetical protein